MLTFSLVQVSNLAQLADTLTWNMTQIPYLCKLMNFHIQMNTVLKLEAWLRRPSFTWITAEEETAIKSTMRGARILTTIYRSLCVTIVSLFAIFPLIDKNSGEEKKLPLPMWFPFDVQNHYHAVWSYEVFGICISAWANTNLDSLSVMLITLTVCQFRMLTKRLRNVGKGTEDVVRDEVVQKELKECIILYNDITRLVELMETTFSNGIFVQFICGVFVICMTGFRMMVVSY
nr:odorant receptor Or1-like [Leptinotarsa decemlineata]